MLYLAVRLLRNFESPYLSIHLLNQKSAATGLFYFVVIRKLIWDPRVEEELMDDPGAVLLLYKQVHHSIFSLEIHFKEQNAIFRSLSLAQRSEKNFWELMWYFGVFILSKLNKNLKNLQAVSDLHNGHFVPCKTDIKSRLLALEEQGNYSQVNIFLFLLGDC